MPRVLIVAADDLTPELGRTVLWRSDIERVFAPSLARAFELTASRPPDLLLLDGGDREATLAFVQRLRDMAGTRRASVAVLTRSVSAAEDEELRRAGANLVLGGHVDPNLWDARLEELLAVPRRREARIKVRFEVWSRFEPDSVPIEALALNISLRGMLLQTPEPVDIGTQLDLAFALPGAEEELRAVGQVVREGQPIEGRPCSGLEFLILRGDARANIRAFVEAASTARA